MADQANIVGTVKVDTAQAVRSVGDLKKAVDTLGTGFAGIGDRADKAFKSLTDGLAKYNQVLGGIQKTIGIAGDVFGMIKFSAQAKFAEQRVKELGLSALELAAAVGGTVDDVTLLQFSLKQLQGESALTKDQLLLVLKAADSLGDQGFGDTMKIAEDLAGVLAGKSARALREYKINIDDLKEGVDATNVLMGKLRDIAAQTVNNDDIERIERIETAFKNLINTLKDGVYYFGVGTAFMAKDSSSYGLASVGSGVVNQGLVNDIQAARARKAAQTQQQAAALLATGQFSGIFDTLNAGVAQWGSAGLGVLPGASWFEQAKKRKPGRGGSVGDPTRGNGSLNFDAISQGFAAAYQQQVYDKSARDLEFANTTTKIAVDNSFAELDEAMKSIAQSADELQRKGLADQMEKLSDVMLVGTPAVVAFADALMTGGNAFGALAKGLQQGLRALAIDSAVKALYALGEGFLFNNPKAFTAAAKYTAAAAAAGVGSAAIGALIGSGGGGASPSSQPGGGSFSGSTIGGGAQESGGFTINVQGNLYGEPAAFARAIADAIDTGQRSGRIRARAPRYH